MDLNYRRWDVDSNCHVRNFTLSIDIGLVSRRDLNQTNVILDAKEQVINFSLDTLSLSKPRLKGKDIKRTQEERNKMIREEWVY